MKKMLILLLLLFVSIVLVGCDSSTESITTTTILTTTTERPGIANREFFLTVIGKLPIQDDDTDTVYEPEYSGKTLGECHLLVYYSDEVSLILAKGQEFAIIDFDLDEAGSVETGYWTVELIYQDDAREIYISLSFYWYGALFHEDYETQYVAVPVKTFRDKLYTLELEDIIWLISQLGYPGIDTL